MGPLSGLKVLELGQVVAAPFCGALLADFGADVIKVEQPIGDGLRYMGPSHEGRSLWFNVENRNKKDLCLDLKTPEGKEILTKLIAEADVMTENFRPGVLAKLGFTWEKIHSINPKLILARMSGYGQTGPYSKRAGYDRVGVGMGGLTFLTGFPDKAPLKPGVSVGDYLVGFATAYGIMVAVYERDVVGSGEGQELDCALFEPIFRILEFTALNYDLTGAIRTRTGNTFAGTVPGDHLETKDGKWISLAVGNDKLFKTLAKLCGWQDFLDDPNLQTQQQRQKNRKVIDERMVQWAKEHTCEEAFALLGDSVPMGPIYDIQGIFNDPHYKAREDIVEVEDEKWGKVHMQGVVPKLSRTPGKVNWIGPDLGAHSEEILRHLGYGDADLEKFKTAGIVKFQDK